MNYKISEPVENLFHLKFKSQHLVASTFIRFQEYYESTQFRNKVFTLEEYMDWYAEKQGKFDYFTEYTGFNIPKSVIESFASDKFYPLTNKESELINRFCRKKEDYYLIGTFRRADIKHELAHGVYYLDRDYRKEADELIKPINIEKFLRENLYHPVTWKDETQAWMIDGYGKTRHRKIQRELRRLLKERLK